MAPRPRNASTSTSWAAEAACAGWPDPEAFFPDRGKPDPAVLALCAGCPVAAACGGQALAERQRYGIWGGTTERDRERVWEEQARRRRSVGSTGRGRAS